MKTQFTKTSVKCRTYFIQATKILHKHCLHISTNDSHYTKCPYDSYYTQNPKDPQNPSDSYNINIVIKITTVLQLPEKLH